MLGDCVTDIRESALKKMELARLSEVGVLGHVSFLSCVFELNENLKKVDAV